MITRLKNDGKAEIALNSLQQKMKIQVDTKVNESRYHFEDIDCPICNSSNKDLLGEKDRYGLSYRTNTCIDCGLVYTSPRMTQESYNEFYNVEYRKLYVGTSTATETFFSRQRSQGQKIYNYLQKNTDLKLDSLTVLEIGCGAGGILDLFREKGNKVKGIDLGAEYVNYGKEKYSLDLEVATLKDISSKDKVDLIIYSHVLEHILDLNSEVELMKEFCHENTLVYIEVPGVKEIAKNYRSNILTYFQNAHTFHFTLESIENLMGKHGFKLLNGNQFVQATFIMNDSEYSLSNDYESVSQYIDNIERKRKLYPFTKRALMINLKNNIVKFLDITHTRQFVKTLRKKLSI